MSDEFDIGKAQQESCPDKDLIAKYVFGELNEKESEAFLHHLSNCEFCQEAVEGMSFLSDKDAFSDIIDGLNQSIDERVAFAGKTAFYRRPFFQLAAVLLVLVLGVFFITKTMKQPAKELADVVVVEKMEKAEEVETAQAESSREKIVKQDKSNPVKKAEEEAVLLEEVVEEEVLLDQESIIPEEEIDEEILVEEAEVIETNDSEKDVYIPQTTTSKSVEGLGYKVSQAAEEEEIQKFRNKEKRKSREKLDKKGSYRVEGYADVPVDSSAVAHEFFMDGMNYYNSGDFKNSQYYLSNALMWDSSIVDAACYSGVSNYNLKNYSQAIDDLNRVISDTESSCLPQAKWYLAQSHLELKQKDEAKKLLEELIQFENEYRKDAEILLKNLK
jgi:TolA-binding protein